MDSIVDQEFGHVRLKRLARAKYIRLRVKPDGTLSVTLPKRAAVRHAKELIDGSRASIRELLEKRGPVKQWQNGDQVGASHRLVLVADPSAAACRTSIHGAQAIVRHHPDTEPAQLQTKIHEFVLKLLRKQAAAYIPRRLQSLAEEHDFSYSTIRYSNAETRWGSCSSEGTISVNIWLMSLPHELIDYVLVHELAHTRHMNHSASFWETVAQCMPHYKSLRTQLKQYSPTP